MEFTDNERTHFRRRFDFGVTNGSLKERKQSPCIAGMGAQKWDTTEPLESFYRTWIRNHFTRCPGAS